MTDRLARARRRLEIVQYFQENGAVATAEKFGINRARVYQILHFMTKVRQPKQSRLEDDACTK